MLMTEWSISWLAPWLVPLLVTLLLIWNEQRNSKQNEYRETAFQDYLAGRKCELETGSYSVTQLAIKKYWKYRWFRNRIQKFNKDGQLTFPEQQRRLVRSGK